MGEIDAALIEAAGTPPADLRPKVWAETYPSTGEAIARLHPDWPRIDCSVWYGPHETGADATGLSEPLDKAAIVLVEAANGGDVNGFVQGYQAIANNDKERLGNRYLDNIVRANGLEGTFDEQFIRGIYGTRKFISSIDLRPDDALTGSDIIQAGAKPSSIGMGYDSALDVFYTCDSRYASLQRQRERIIAPRLEPRLEAYFAAHPELYLESAVNVLIIMGRIHDPTFTKELTDCGFDVTAIRQRGISESEGERLTRSLMLGKEPTQPQLARAYFEHNLSGLVYEQLTQEPGFSHNTWYSFLGQAAMRFSMQDIQAVHQLVASGRWSLERADAVLAQKGLELPRTVTRLGAIVAAHLKE